MTEQTMSALFFAAADCGRRQGIQGKAVHHYDGPDGLHIVLNSTSEKAEFLEPIHMAIFTAKGQAFPIAVLHPYGGQVIANPKWTEDSLIEALDAHVPDKEAPRSGT